MCPPETVYDEAVHAIAGAENLLETIKPCHATGRQSV